MPGGEKHDSCTMVTVYTTLGDEAAAEGLARRLLDERLVACANLVPLRSLYRWQGRIEEAREVGVLLKTERDRVAALMDRLPELHPYEVPCVEVWPVEAVHAPFGAWVRAETRGTR